MTTQNKQPQSNKNWGSKHNSENTGRIYEKNEDDTSSGSGSSSGGSSSGLGSSSSSEDSE